MSKRLICLCNFVDEEEILATLKKGARSSKDIQHHTRGGTSCGRCLPQIDDIVEDFGKSKPKDQQKRLDFGRH